MACRGRAGSGGRRPWSVSVSGPMVVGTTPATVVWSGGYGDDAWAVARAWLAALGEGSSVRVLYARGQRWSLSDWAWGGTPVSYR